MGTGLEMPRKAARRNVARIEACRVSRIAARAEVAGTAGCRDLIRRPDQQGAEARRQPPEPHNHGHKMKREPQPFRQIRN